MMPAALRRPLRLLALALVPVSAPPSSLAAQDPSTADASNVIAAALAELDRAGQPVQQHRRLDAFAGDWSVEARWNLPGAMGAPMRGHSRNVWILGGRFLRCDVEFGEGAARVEAFTLYGFDRGTGLFTAIGASDAATNLFSITGHYDPDTRSFVLSGEYRHPVTAALTTYRQRLVVEGSDRYTLELFYDPRDALPQLILEATFTRATAEAGAGGGER